MLQCVLMKTVFIVALLVHSSQTHSGGCILENITGAHEHRPTHFTYNGEVLPILLEGSDFPHPLQDFLNHIIKIIGMDVLGYTDIAIVTPPKMYHLTDTSYALERLSGCAEASCETRSSEAPSVNMAMWMSNPIALEGWPSSGSAGVVAQGNHALYGRYGWYVSSHIVTTMWEGSRVVGDHWRSFQDSQYISALSVSGNLIHDSTDDIFSYCNEPECSKGIFYPPWCNNATAIAGGASHSDCALLISDYSDLNFHMVTSQILTLHLNVKVGWVGPNMHYIVTRLVDLAQPVLFFTMTPNDLLHYSSFSRVSFPACPLPDVVEGDIPVGGCDCPWHPITKMVWTAIEENAPQLSNLIQNICVDDDLAEEIFLSYLESPADDMGAFACNWMQKNPNIWLGWLPADALSVRRQIYLPGLFPTMDESDEEYGLYYGAAMAVQAINKDSAVLPMVELKMISYGTLCQSEATLDIYSAVMQENTKPLAAVKAVQAIIKDSVVLPIVELKVISYGTLCQSETTLDIYCAVMQDNIKQIAGFLGPACSSECENLSDISKYFNQVIVSYFAESSALAAKDRHPFVFRVFPDSQQIAFATERIFTQFGWSQFALLSEDGVEADSLTVEDYLLMSGMECLYCVDVGDQNAEETVSGLKDAKPEVILLYTSQRYAQEIVCQAYKQDLFINAGYIWVIPLWYHDNWWDLDRHNLTHVIGCSTENMRTVLSGTLSLTRVNLADAGDTLAGGIRMSSWLDDFTAGVGSMNTSSAIAMGAYAYDAVWTFALALQELMESDVTHLDSMQSDHTSMLFREFLQNTSFSGATGRVEFISQDRRGPVTIMVNMFTSDDPHQEILGQYIPAPGTIDQGELYIDTEVVNLIKEEFGPFKGGDDPLKVCAIEGIRMRLGSSCASAFVVVCLLFTLIFLVMALSLGLLFKKKYDKKVKEAELRMKELGLLNLGMDSLATLDKWEMPRENVILNRKLGEGAFGTVYGGQALLEGQIWDAVAVKTLKMGSSIEEKLDFLSEAEMMKRFEHDNIVRLRGVCTYGEPLYAVMDFMLYGDLKTFLLARRHLVGQQCVEAEVLHPIRLTRMVYDIVSGLDYLAKNKYVHRDLACRNCLVDASYHVKIGDFGMTRALYDSDYYRLCKQGRLPIRWMAPESVAEGLFTLMSDIWSLGIVIYEIVTFGGFPYPEMSNAVVLEFIKDRNSMTPPDNCPTMLSSLMMQCWVIEASVRPTTDEILNLLENNPEIIVPCISEPHESVSIDGLSSETSFSPGVRSNRSSFRSSDQSSQGSSIRFKSSFGSLRRAFTRKKIKKQDQSKVSPGLLRRRDIEMGHDFFTRQEYLRNSNRSEPSHTSRSKGKSDLGSRWGPRDESIQRFASFDGILECPSRKTSEESFEGIGKSVQSLEKEHSCNQEFKHRLLTKARSDSAPLISKKKSSLKKNRSRSMGNNDSVKKGSSVNLPTGIAVISSNEVRSNIYITNF